MTSEAKTGMDLAIVAAPVISAIVDTWLKPKLELLFRSHKTRKALLQEAFVSSFEEYLNESAKRHSFITTIVFQNQRQLLDDLYVPLTLEASPQQGRIRLEGYAPDLLPKHEKVLIVDTAGMGKSTALKYLFVQCVKANAGIPIFVELRQLSAERSLLDVVYDELETLDGVVDKDLVLALVRRGDFIFFLDGYDEIPPPERPAVTRALQSFVVKAPGNRFILSSRPEPGLSSFADFQQFTIKPLSVKEALSLIRKYGRDGDAATQLISKLKGETLASLQEFLTNPLLVSLLYKCYEYKPTIPLRKHIFYRQVYDALYESHDLTKGGAYARTKHSGLDIDDFHRVLRHFGYITFTHGTVEYSKDAVLKHLETAATQCPGVACKPAELLKDLTSKVPLFVLEGTEYRWSHKSIQEYFAAQFICVDAKTSQTAILEKLASSPERHRYNNVLDLCYDIDYKTFRRTLIVPLAQRYLEYLQEASAFLCPEAVPIDQCRARLQLMFGRMFVVFPASLTNSPEALEFESFMKYAAELGVIRDSNVYTGLMVWPGYGAVLTISDRYATLVDILAQKGDPLITGVDVKLAKRHVTPRAYARGKRPVILDSTMVVKIGARGSYGRLNQLLVETLHREPLSLSAPKCEQLVAEAAIEAERERELDTLVSKL